MKQNNDLRNMEVLKKGQEAQGAKKTDTDKKTEDRNPSLSYTIKSLGGNIKKLKHLKVVTEEELQQLVAIRTKLVQKYIALDLEM